MYIKAESPSKSTHDNTSTYPHITLLIVSQKEQMGPRSRRSLTVHRLT